MFRAAPWQCGVRFWCLRCLLLHEVQIRRLQNRKYEKFQRLCRCFQVPSVHLCQNLRSPRRTIIAQYINYIGLPGILWLPNRKCFCFKFQDGRKDITIEYMHIVEDGLQNGVNVGCKLIDKVARDMYSSEWLDAYDLLAHFTERLT